MNYLGQLRVYSLTDLVLLLLAAGAGDSRFAGAIILHLSFLLYLESRHQHQGRTPFPWYLWIGLAAVGLGLYHHMAGFAFLVCGFLYAEKKTPTLGMVAPVFRGLQMLFLVGGIAGFDAAITWMACALLMLRNLAGDVRDVTQDRREDMTTIPIAVGMHKDVKNLHIIVLLLTSTVWWHIAGLSWIWLAIAYIMELTTYWLTPRYREEQFQWQNTETPATI